MPFNSTDDLEHQLESMPMVDPPSVKAAVMNQISTSARRPVAGALRGRRPRRFFAIAYAAAAILVIVVAIQHATPPARNSAASMVTLDVEDAPIIARVSSGDAHLTIRGNGDQFLAEATGGTIDWDHAKLTVISFRNHGVLLQRRAAGRAVVRLRLPDHKELFTTIDLR
jgi:hypothetical protein